MRVCLGTRTTKTRDDRRLGVAVDKLSTKPAGTRKREGPFSNFC